MKTDTRYSGTWLCRVFLQQRRLLAAAGRTQGAQQELTGKET